MATFSVFTGSDKTTLTNALLAPNSGIIIDNSTITLNKSGTPAVNFYDGSLTKLGIAAGLLLTSGTTPGTGTAAIPANTMGWFGQSNGGAGDADINAVVNTVFKTQSYDATTLSFDFTVSDTTATSITFDLVMGSDEYPEWVNSFVDSAVVLVNGVNYALFNHNLNNPLSVVSQNLAAGYFQDNAASVLPIEYDGVSQVLKIVAPINAGKNHIKIGVADTGDHIYDTGLFIANLSAGNVPGSGMVVTPPSSGTTGDDNLTGSSKDEYFDLQSGNDIVYSGIGDDIISGGLGNDAIFGGSGNDQLEGDEGNDDIDGGDGLSDTAIYTGKSKDYSVKKDAAGGFYTVTSLVDGSVDTLKNIEIIKFSDTSVNLTPISVSAPAPSISTSAPPPLVVVSIPTPPPAPAVPPPPPNNVGAVFVSGIGAAGQTLTASVSDPDGASLAIVYNWYVSKNEGANWSKVGSGATYTVKNTDAPTGNLDAFIKVHANYTDDKNHAENIDSASKKILETEDTGDLLITLMKLDAPEGASIINPLTTLVQNAIELGKSPNEAEKIIKTVLGLPEVSLQNYDSYDVLQYTPTDLVALAVEKIAVQVAVLTSLSDDDSAMKLTSVLLNSATGKIFDLGNSDDLTTILGAAFNTDNPERFHEISKRNKSIDDGIIDALEKGESAVEAIQKEWADMQSIQDQAISSQNIADLSIHVNQSPTGSATANLNTILDAVEDSSFSIAESDLLIGFSDSDDGNLHVSNLTVDASVGSFDGFTFKPANNYNGPVEFTYTVTDGQYDPTGIIEGSISANQFFVIKAVNDAPEGEVTINNDTDSNRGISAAQRGDKLSVDNSLSDADGTSQSVIHYQWQRNGENISGADKTSYTLTQNDVGAAIGVLASYTDDTGKDEEVLSEATNPIIQILGNAPAQLTKSTPNAWVNAWTASDVAITHKADYISSSENWSAVSLKGLSAKTLSGVDVYTGDLGVSGQTAKTSNVKQEIDGTEALRFELVGETANHVSVNLSRLFSIDDKISGHNEAGRLQAFKNGIATGDEVFFQGGNAQGTKTVALDVTNGFDSLVFTAGAYNGTTFVSGAYLNNNGGYVAPDAAHGSDYLIDTILIGVSPI